MQAIRLPASCASVISVNPVAANDASAASKPAAAAQDQAGRNGKQRPRFGLPANVEVLASRRGHRVGVAEQGRLTPAIQRYPGAL